MIAGPLTEDSPVGAAPADFGPHLAAIVRPTNLEDVFLRLTGTSLELGEAGA